ncbi:hypothetical protein NQ317_005290 [Molorchus minor]|uniref:Amino acid transporter n=1 Tax=Molorchus minor TaxID=1323400 RepID=A0ABQ9J630_9CUCU|nr:hypothetical protein NQ317_005290 [Molorchus minor]
MPHHHNFHIVEVSEKDPSRNKCLGCLRSNVLTIATVGGVIMGAVLGVVLRITKDEWTEREIMYVGYIGTVFLQMLKSLILPLIVSSLISAIANLDLSLSGKIAARTIAFYLTTTFAAVVLGIVLVVTIKPGAGQEDVEASSSEESRNTTTVDTLLDLVKNMFPPNLVEACIFQYRTNLVAPNDSVTDIYQYTIETETVQNTNILGLVVASAVVGIAVAQLGNEAKTIANLFQNLMALMMKVTGWVITLSPVGITFLVAAEILEMENISSAMSSLGLSATLPLTIQCLEDKLGIDPRVARFALPIGSTINMDGTALYEAVAAIFIAQIRNVSLDFGSLVAISITATAASIGAAGIPQAGLVTMVMVLDTVGLPAEDVSLILAVDWLLDRFRTAINVLGDAFGAAIVDHRSEKELRQISTLTPSDCNEKKEIGQEPVDVGKSWHITETNNQ